MIPFFVALIAGLLIADPAHAGFLVPIVAGAFGGGALATTVSSIALGVAGSLVSRAMQPRQRAQGPGAMELAAPTSGDATPQTIILGRRATAGHRTAPEYSRGGSREWLTIIRDLSDMPVHRLHAVWINGDRLVLPDTLGDWWEPATGKYAGKFRLRFYDGTQTAADPLLVSAYGSHPDRPWTADMRLLGVAYVIVELWRDPEVYPSQPDLLFEVDGARLIDPRTGQLVWSRNAALLAYNVMRGIQMPDGTIYGGGIADEDLPLASWASAISECQAQGWNASLIVNVGPEEYGGDHPYQVVDDLMQACAGQVAESGGAWRVRVGGPGLPVATVIEADVIVSENQVFEPHQGPREVCNGITSQYAEPGERWEPKTTPLLLEDAYVARDGGRNVIHLTRVAVTDGQQAQQLDRMALEDNRRQRTHELSLPSDYDPVEVLDTLALSLPYDGYQGKLVEVLAKTTDPVTMRQRVHVREVDPADFTPPAVAPLPTVPVVTTPPAPQALPGWAVEPLIVQDAEGRNRRAAVRIMWTPLPAEGIEWQLRSQGATELAGEGTHADVGRGQRIITAGVIQGTSMQIRGRAVLRNRARAWTAWTHFIAPSVALGPWDLDVEAIRDDVRESLADLTDWMDGTGDVIRGVRDEIGAIRDLSTESDFGNLLERQEIRRELAIEVGDARAAFNEAIEVVVGDLGAQARRTTSLTAEFRQTVARFSEDLRVFASDQIAIAERTTVLEAELGDARSEFREEIDVIASDLVSAVGVTTQLRTDFDGNVAEVNESLIALARDDEALAGRIDDVEASIGDAVGQATQALVSRVTQVERVAGTQNRVHRQANAPTNNVTNGDYWQNTTTEQWHERVANAWVAIPASQVPRIIIQQSANSDAITQVTARTNRGTAQGRLRVSAASTPEGVRSRIGLHAEANDGLVQNSASMFLEASTSGLGQVVFNANRFSIVTNQDGNDPVGPRRVPFIVQGNTVYMDEVMIREAVLSTALIAPNAISRMLTVSTTQRLRKDPHFNNLNTWVSQSPDIQGVRPGWVAEHATLETRALSIEYLTGLITAPYEYDLYFWVALSGGDCVANLFLNNQNAAYQGYRHRTSLDVWDHRISASGAMVGCVPSQTGNSRLTIGLVGIDGSEDVNMISASMTMMAVMK